jgi:predicted nucleic acid-binding Zn ribbon protein
VSDKTPSELRLVRSPAPGSAQGAKPGPAQGSERGSSRGSEPGPTRSPASGPAQGPKLELVKSSEPGSAKAPASDPERGSSDSGSGSAKSAAAKGAAMAREKLAQAKSDAAKRGQLPRREPRRKAYGPRRDSGDPQLFGRAIADLLADRGWEQPAAVGGVFGRWHEIVGPDMAAHTTPETFADGEVLVVADSTAWATQVRLLARTLVRRLNEELGDGTVQRVKVRGPQNGPRPSGGLRVTGSRGPGDTYG